MVDAASRARALHDLLAPLLRHNEGFSGRRMQQCPTDGLKDIPNTFEECLKVHPFRFDNLDARQVRNLPRLQSQQTQYFHDIARAIAERSVQLHRIGASCGLIYLETYRHRTSRRLRSGAPKYANRCRKNKQALVEKWRIIGLALLLGACASSSPYQAVSGRPDWRAYSGNSDIPAMESAGLHKLPYDVSMNLVPCMKYAGSKHVAMSMPERLQYREEHGGYLSDCGVSDEGHVWG